MAGFEKIDHKDSAYRELKTLIENGVYAIVYKESEKVIGNFAIEPLPELFTKNARLKSKNGVTLSFALSNQYQRKGLISEILEKIIHWLFNEQNIDFINCGYFNFNQASCNLQKKFGFEYYGTHMVHRPNQEIETIEMVLFKNHNRE